MSAAVIKPIDVPPSHEIVIQVCHRCAFYVSALTSDRVHEAMADHQKYCRTC
jgi:hypothetical protein